MPQRNPTKTTTEPQRWTPPAGIYYERNRQRPARPFMLRWKAEGKARSQSFASESEREDAARDLARKRADHGSDVLTFDVREWRRWLEFRERAGDNDPLDILREWQLSRIDAGASSAAIAVRDAVKTYATHRAEGSLSKDTRRHIRKHVEERFGGYFAGEKLRDVTPTKISEWLRTLMVSRGKRKSEPVEPLTRRHHRKDVNTFFDYCVQRGWIARNPVDLVPVPHVEEHDVELLTVEEGRRLFAANRGERIAPRLALEAFGFLRASSAGRIQQEHVNFAERGIRMPGAEHKSRKAKFRQGHPDNLWQWLRLATADTWSMSWWEYRNEKRDAFVRAKIQASDNRLRKTCLSAHLAWQKNQPLTSYLAQHRHTSTTEIYLGTMTERDGAAWFGIAP